MCKAQFAPSSPAPSAASSSSAIAAGTTSAPSAPAASVAQPQGGSKTHTIIVAPTQGVLRFGASFFLFTL
jgi:hypothetical protein